jgi:muramidase (phage lysozyme)
MVESNNQRKAFLDMLAWSEGTDNGRQKTRNHGYDVIVGGELFTDYSDHPRKLVTLNPKLKSTAAGRYQLLSRWWDAYRKQLGLKDFSPKSQDAVALQQIKERGALPMIDRGDIRQAIDRCSNIWASLPGAGYGQYEHKIDSLIAKFKEAGGTVREIEVFLAFIADVVLASPSSPVGVHRRRVWKHKLIFVHGLIFPSFSSIACVLITPSRW